MAKAECGIPAGSHRHALGDGMQQKHTVMQGDDSSLGREASEHSWGSLNSGQLGEKSFTTKSKSQGLKTQGLQTVWNTEKF